MTMRSEKTDKKFDVLDRFFKRKKAAAAVNYSTTTDTGLTAEASCLSHSDPTTQTFPQPSFIRPSSMRMVARDDVGMNLKPSRRARSLPEPANPDQRASVASGSELLSRTAIQLDNCRVPGRSSSLRHQKLGELSLDELLNLSIPDHINSSIDNRWSSLFRSRSTSSRAESPRQSKRLTQYGEGSPARPSHPETPPLSAKQEGFPQSTHPGGSMRPLHASVYANPTPEPSPQFRPSPGPHPLEVELSQYLSRQQRNSLDHVDSSTGYSMGSMRRSLSHSALPRVNIHIPTADSILKEPMLSEFLSLSDDDIADGQLVPPSKPPFVSNPPTCALPPDPPVPVPTARTPKQSQLAAPISLRRLPAAAAAALEAARIAERYVFDLVYVISLSPGNVGCSRPRSHSKKASLASVSTIDTSFPSSFLCASESPRDQAAFENTKDSQSPPRVCVSPRLRMTGRLLAAYGLSSVMTPFRISAAVHRKALMTDGWLEYRSDGNSMDEFVRGYTCSFHKGYSPEGKWRPLTAESVPGSPSSDSSEGRAAVKRRDRRPNRGIVFAAYRLPRADGGDIGSDATELAALHNDAEALVEMLVDAHANREKLSFAAMTACSPKGANIPFVP